MNKILILAIFIALPSGASNKKNEEENKDKAGICVECIRKLIDDSFSPLSKTIKDIDKERTKINQCVQSKKSCSSISQANQTIFNYINLLRSQMQQAKSKQTDLLIKKVKERSILDGLLYSSRKDLINCRAGIIRSTRIKAKKKSVRKTNPTKRFLDNVFSPLSKTIKDIDKEQAKINQCVQSEKSCSSISQANYAIFNYINLLRSQMQQAKSKQEDFLIKNAEDILHIKKRLRVLDEDIDICIYRLRQSLKGKKRK